MYISEESKDDYHREISSKTTQEIKLYVRKLRAEEKIMKIERLGLQYEIQAKREELSEKKRIIQMRTKLPHLVAHIKQIFNVDDEDSEEKAVVLETTDQLVTYIPMSGLVNVKDLKVGDVVGVNRRTHIIASHYPHHFSAIAESGEVKNKLTVKENEVRGLKYQFNELDEVMTLMEKKENKENKENLKFELPKGILLTGPPGTGKTQLVRHCAAKHKITLYRFNGAQFINKHLGEGANLVREIFACANERSPAIIFIDEVDAICQKRYSGMKDGDKEAQRTLTELLNQMDGFKQNKNIKVILSTSRADLLDAALMRSGRVDRQIRFNYPDKNCRVSILELFINKMKINDEKIDFKELASLTEDFTGAELKSICNEAGMIAVKNRDYNGLKYDNLLTAIENIHFRNVKSVLYYA